MVQKFDEAGKQIANMGQSKDSVCPLPSEQIKPIKRKVPQGKCPIYFTFQDDKPTGIDIKESYLSMDSPGEAALQDLTGTKDLQIAQEILLRGICAMPHYSLESNYNTISQALADSEPKDSTEAKLCMQGTVLYSQGMDYLRRAEKSERFDHSEYYMKYAIKLLRLHNETIETLNKHRRGGEQRVVVQHVQVNDGGQAIVGSVLNGGGVNRKNVEVTPC